MISSITGKDWYSKHPDGAPYFLEYLPLLDEKNRVAGFDPSVSYERFIPPRGPSGTVSEVEASYVRGLIAHTEARGQIPVLTATRSIGRVAGLKAAAPGLHILLYRNLFQQWCSYTEQANRAGTYFLDRTLEIIRLSQHDPVIREISALFPTDAPSVRDRNSFYQFVFLHLYCYAHSASAVDFIIDINRVAIDPSHRGEVEAVFDSQNIRIDLSQTRQSMAFSLIDFPSVTELREFLTVTGRAIIGSAPSEAGRRFANRVLSDLLEEHDRHEFHAKAMRSVLGHAVGVGEAARAEVDLLRGRHDALQNERDALLVAAGEEQRARETALSEREAARLTVEAMCHERDAARAEVDAMCRERNTALTNHDTSVQALRTAEAERDAAVAERDAARNAHGVAEAERNAAVAERDAAHAQRDAEAEARQTAIAERDAALAERDAAQAQRNAEVEARQAALTERDAFQADAVAARRACEAAVRDRSAEAAGHRAAEAARVAAFADREAALAAQAMEAAARQTALAERHAAETRYADLLRWSVAFHDATANSLSWKLTRPLRWLKIGRPKRSEGPPP